MTDEKTIEKLMNLRLTTMARAFRDQLADSPGSQLTFSERVAFMVDREWTDRESRRLARLMRSARLSVSDAAMENISCDPARGIDKSVIRELATCKWIKNKQNVVVVGKTGVGKTFFAAALAQAACRHGLRALCTRVPRLLHEISMARADGTYAAALGRLAKLDVLILDDFLIAPLKDQKRRDLVEILEDRYGKVSTVVTSQVPTKTGMRRLPTLRWPTPSAIVWCTTPMSSPSAALQCAKRKGCSPRSISQPPDLKFVAALRSGQTPSLRSVFVPKSSGILAQVVPERPPR